MVNWENQTLWTGDNLDIMRGMNSDSVDLIYLDPPFNSNANYAAPIGSQAAGAEFKDTWGLDEIKLAWHALIKQNHSALYDYPKAVREIHNDSMMAYLIYMAIRIMEMKRLLKDTGSIYLHCDPTASHYLKMLMDCVLGRECFRNEIIWHYSGWNAKLASNFNRRHDIVFYYSKSVHKKSVKFNSCTSPWVSEKEYIHARKQKVMIDLDGRQYVTSDAGGGKRVKRYLIDAMQYGKPVDDVWSIDKLNNSAKEAVGYPTQKPLALLKRIIKASSNYDDVVLDPFCGCATACIAAEAEQRNWVGIDISQKQPSLFNTGWIKS